MPVQIPIALGTISELKKIAAERALDILKESHAFKLLPTPVESGVSVQPHGFAEIRMGAENRAENARRIQNVAMGLGIESGIVVPDHGRPDELFDSACVVILYNGSVAVSYSALYPLPPHLIQRIRGPREDLGTVVQALAGGGQKDPHMWLSGNRMAREDLLTDAIAAAFLKVINPAMYLSQ